MSSTVLIGTQWGDEGKGKITDYLCESAEVVVRYQGGNNAGHTVIVGDIEYKLHLIPSGIIYPNTLCLIGNGVVVDPEILLKEMEYLREKGIDINESNLKISSHAHLIMPYHKILDGLEEEARGDQKIGTTKRGIGPCYVDKISRVGIRFSDFIDEELFETKLKMNINLKNDIITKLHNSQDTLDFEAIKNEFKTYRDLLSKYVDDVPTLINEAIEENKKVLFEGAQGTLLDIDHGTYPFVTSSNPTAGFACTGAGVGPTKISRVLGVTKAYLTRVGEGPFPTELFDEVGEHLGSVGHEFGTTTGRQRRCGWFDGVLMKYSTNINGITDLAVTKLDVLDQLDKIKICTAYEINGVQTTIFPDNLKKLDMVKPIFEELDGWKSDTTKVRSYEQLPENAKKYLQRISEFLNVKVSIVAVGPKRDETIIINKVL